MACGIDLKGFNQLDIKEFVEIKTKEDDD